MHGHVIGTVKKQVGCFFRLLLKSENVGNKRGDLVSNYGLQADRLRGKK